MSKVLVTGAGGFVGANLIRKLLARKDEVHILHRPESVLWRLKEIKNQLKSHNAELSDNAAMLKLVKNIRPEHVYHLAQYGCNPGENDPAIVRKVIIEGAGALFDACSQVSSVKAVINMGSALEYGNRRVSMKEDMLIKPATPYGCAKAWSTHYGQDLSRQNKTPITTLRPFFIFGPWQPKTRFMPAVILACLRGQTPQISNLETVRDFIFVDEVVRALILVADKGLVGAVINIGAGRQMTLKDAAEIIIKNTGAKVNLSIGIEGRAFEKTGDMWQADISLAKKLLNWQPEISQKDGIIKTIKWFNENQNLYKTI